ncbi:TPA: WYL domain-containing protein [Photobacterium damselae]
MSTYEELRNKHKNNADRFAYIDFMLRFTGSVTRADIGEQFNLTLPGATKVLADYKESYPGNLTYSHSLRTNVLESSYKNLIDWDAETVLGMLANGFNRNKLSKTAKIPVQYEKLNTLPTNLSLSTIEVITRAISRKQAIKCEYYSKNSDNRDERTLVPLNILFDGEFWIFRAYDRSEKNPNKSKFKFFNFARVLSITELFNEEEIGRQEHEELNHDIDWNLELPLELVIHEDRQKNHEAEEIRIDFGIDPNSNYLLLMKRAAYFWILKRKWHIDTRTIDEITLANEEYAETKLRKQYFKFRLANRGLVEMIIKNAGSTTKLD